MQNRQSFLGWWEHFRQVNGITLRIVSAIPSDKIHTSPIAGMRTPFADYNGALANVSPIDLGIKAARAVFAKTGLPASDVGDYVRASISNAGRPHNVRIRVELDVETLQIVSGTGEPLLRSAGSRANST